jgi:hypothetical protein
MSKEQKNELVPIQNSFPVLAQDTYEVAELLTENLGNEGIDRFALERIKMGAGGSPGYVICPADSTDDQTPVKEFQAIVVHDHGSRTYYKQAFGTGDAQAGSPPDCASNDGETGQGDNGESIGIHQCSSCPQAQWGSHSRGAGQACAAQRVVYLYRSDCENIFPSMLVVPPTSLTPWKNYKASLTNKMIRMTGALHTFQTIKKNKGGNDTTILAPKFERKLTDEEKAQVATLAESIKGLVQMNAGPTAPSPSKPQTTDGDVDYGKVPFD